MGGLVHAASHLELSQRSPVWFCRSIDMGELERDHAAGRYDQSGRVGHRGAAFRRGRSPAIAGVCAARPCPRSPWMAWTGAIIAGTGAPYALVAAAGLHFAPACDGGALNPGCMPLFVALIAAIGLGKK